MLETIVKHVKIDLIDPNPHRSFEVFPINEEQVAELMASITRTADWGTLPARQVDGRYQIAAGHHRLEAMRRLEFRDADLKIADYTDDAMLQIMIAENASQHGGNPLSQMDSVLAAAKFLIYATFISPTLRDLSTLVERPPFESDHAYEVYRGIVMERQEVGSPTVVTYLDGAMARRAVETCLADAKATGQLAAAFKYAEEQAATVLEARAEEERRIQEEAERARVKAEEDAERARIAQAKAKEERARIAEELKKAQETAKRARLEAEAKEAKAREQRERRMAEAREKLIEEKRKERETSMARLWQAEQERKKAREAARKAEQVEPFIDRAALDLFENNKQREAFRSVIANDRQQAQKHGSPPSFAKETQVELAREIIKAAGGKDRVTYDFIRQFLQDRMTQHDAWRREMDRKREAVEEALNFQRRAVNRADELQAAMRRFVESLRAFDEIVAESDSDPNKAETIQRIIRPRLQMMGHLDSLEIAVQTLRSRLGLQRTILTDRRTVVEGNVTKIINE